MAEFDDVYIGGHSKLQVVYVVGKVQDAETLDRLLAYVESKRPPFKMLHGVKVSGDGSQSD